MSDQSKAAERQSEGRAIAPLVASNQAVARIVPKNSEDAKRLAGIMFAANMAPNSYKNEGQVLIGILKGMELGLPPVSALSFIYVVNNRPTVWGDGALGLVQASGKLKRFEEKMVKDPDEGWIAYCTVERTDIAGTVERNFSHGDAKTAGLLGKDTWQKYPKRMLQMRARSWALRDCFADVLSGLLIAEEEVDRMDPIDVTPREDPGKRLQEKFSGKKEAPESEEADEAEIVDAEYTEEPEPDPEERFRRGLAMCEAPSDVAAALHAIEASEAWGSMSSELRERLQEIARERVKELSAAFDEDPAEEPEAEEPQEEAEPESSSEEAEADEAPAEDPAPEEEPKAESSKKEEPKKAEEKPKAEKKAAAEKPKDPPKEESPKEEPKAESDEDRLKRIADLPSPMPDDVIDLGSLIWSSEDKDQLEARWALIKRHPTIVKLSDPEKAKFHRGNVGGRLSEIKDGAMK